MVSLTTITYLDRVNDQPPCYNHNIIEKNESVHKLPISNCRELASKPLHSSGRGSLYLEALAYETICKIYQVFHKSSLTTHISKQTFEALQDTFGHKTNECLKSTAASLTYKPTNEGVKIVPDLGNWMVHGFVTIRDKLRTNYQPLYTHPMIRSELTKILTSLNQEDKGMECVHPNITLWAHKTILTPETTFRFGRMNEFPETALVLPATGGLSLELHCTDRNNRTDSHFYACVPRQYDVGNLTCMTFIDNSSRKHLSRHKRNSRSLSQIISNYFNLTHFSNLFNKNSSHAISVALKKTRNLLPSIMGCGASVAGCDYCMYFLTTYNLTVSPAACVGGCSLGTFASCSALVGTSFVNTYNNS